MKIRKLRFVYVVKDVALEAITPFGKYYVMKAGDKWYFNFEHSKISVDPYTSAAKAKAAAQADYEQRVKECINEV